MPVQIVLVRHAVHDRVASVLCGRMPGVRLSAEGQRQTEALGVHLARLRPCAVYTSPQLRARETAAPIGRHAGMEPMPAADLDEIDFGSWTGCCFTALADDPRWQAWNGARASGCAPEGEAMEAVQHRTSRWLAAMGERHSDGSIVAVSHGDVIRTMLCAVLGLSLDSYWRFEISPASASTVLIDAGIARVLTMNETMP